MKTKTLIIVIFFSSFYSISLNEDSTKLNDSFYIENIVHEPIKEGNKTEEEIIAEKNAQWFMYGFLALGAFLVFWKFKYNK